MFRLPVCPHCHAIYRYGDVRKSLNTKIHTCYHCKKQFKTSFSGLWILFLIAVVIGIFVNIFEMTAFSGTNVIALIQISYLYCFFCFLCRFLQNSENSEQTLKKAKIFKYQKSSRKNKRTKTLFVHRINGGKCFG